MLSGPGAGPVSGGWRHRAALPGRQPPPGDQGGRQGEHPLCDPPGQPRARPQRHLHLGQPRGGGHQLCHRGRQEHGVDTRTQEASWHICISERCHNTKKLSSSQILNIVLYVAVTLTLTPLHGSSNGKLWRIQIRRPCATFSRPEPVSWQSGGGRGHPKQTIFNINPSCLSDDQPIAAQELVTTANERRWCNSLSLIIQSRDVVLWNKPFSPILW